MLQRSLGNSGVTLSEVGIGTWELAGDVWGKKTESDSIRAILTGLEHGATFIDTAAGYGGGLSEKIVAKAMSEWGGATEVAISSKILPMNGVFAPDPYVPIEDAYPYDWIIQQAEESLVRLKMECLDILFIHTWSRAWGHEDGWLRALEDLKKSGKIRASGISIPDEGIADANVAVALNQIDAIQCVYNLFQQEPEYSLFPLAKRHNVGIIARSPFSSGVIAQSWAADHKFEEGDWRASWPLGVKPDWFEDQIRMEAETTKALSDYDGTSVEAAIQYILDSDAVTSVIPGSSNPAHVASNMSACKAKKLLPQQSERIRELWRDGVIRGTYNGSI